MQSVSVSLRTRLLQACSTANFESMFSSSGAVKLQTALRLEAMHATLFSPLCTGDDTNLIRSSIQKPIQSFSCQLPSSEWLQRLSLMACRRCSRASAHAPPCTTGTGRLRWPRSSSCTGGSASCRGGRRSHASAGARPRPTPPSRSRTGEAVHVLPSCTTLPTRLNSKTASREPHLSGGHAVSANRKPMRNSICQMKEGKVTSVPAKSGLIR